MKTIQDARKELDEYADIQQGWDLDKGVPPNPKHVEIAQKFISALPENFSAPSPMLGSSGKVGFYWYERPFFLDVEIEENEKLSVLIRVGTYRTGKERWYPSVSLEECVAIYTANVEYWIMELNGVVGLMP